MFRTIKTSWGKSKLFCFFEKEFKFNLNENVECLD